VIKPNPLSQFQDTTNRQIWRFFIFWCAFQGESSELSRIRDWREWKHNESFYRFWTFSTL